MGVTAGGLTETDVNIHRLSFRELLGCPLVKFYFSVPLKSWQKSKIPAEGLGTLPFRWYFTFLPIAQHNSSCFFSCESTAVETLLFLEKRVFLLLRVK
jgi:hypothetical protein